MKKKKHLSGRSIAELITTIAIMGILSVIGVWETSNLLTRHKVNIIMEDVRMAALAIADSEGLFASLPSRIEEDEDENEHGDISLNGRFYKQSSYDFTAYREGESENFAIVVSGISKQICQIISVRQAEWLQEIKPNGYVNEFHDENNSISFFLNTQLRHNNN